MDDADNQAGDEEQHGGRQWVRQASAADSARFPNGAPWGVGRYLARTPGAVPVVK